MIRNMKFDGLCDYTSINIGLNFHGIILKWRLDIIQYVSILVEIGINNNQQLYWMAKPPLHDSEPEIQRALRLYINLHWDEFSWTNMKMVMRYYIFAINASAITKYL